MRKLILYASALLVSTMMLSCSDKDEQPVDPKLEVNQTAISATAVAGEYSIAVESNGNWTASVVYAVEPATGWITLTGTPGENNGTIKVKVAANTETTIRTAKVVVKMGELTKNVPIDQAAADANLNVDTTPINAAVEGGEYTITVESNTAWTAVVVDAEEHDWVTLMGATGSGNGEIKVTVTENETTTNRNAVIAVSTENGEPVNVTVQQNAADMIFSIDKTEIYDVPTAGATYTVTVTANVAWTATETSEFITLTGATGSGNGTFTIKVGLNELTTTREATVTVTPDGGTPETITVRQLAVPVTLKFSEALTVAPISLLSNGGSKSGAVESNIEWKITSSEGWLKTSPTTGTGYTDISVYTYDPNPTTSVRTATLTLSAVSAEGVTPVTLDVSQAALVPQLQFQEWESALTFPAEPGNDDAIFAVVQANIAWTVSPSESWLKPAQTSGTNGGFFWVTADANPMSSVRTATLTLAAATLGGVTPVVVTFTQEAGEDSGPTGVTVNGVTWATSNLSANGTFADAMNDVGAFFQFNSNTAWAATGTLESTTGWTTVNQAAGDWLAANGPCPDGWHVPTSTELNRLIAATSKRRVETSTFGECLGYWYGDDASAVSSATYEDPKGCVFIPRIGRYRNTNDPNSFVGQANRDGYYWGATGSVGSYTSQNASALSWTTGNPSVTDVNKNQGRAVRCAKDAE